jgi:hypothetical protein
MAARSRHIPVDWSVQAITVSGMVIPVARLIVSACFRLIGTGRASLPELCWLDTGAPRSRKGDVTNIDDARRDAMSSVN